MRKLSKKTIEKRNAEFNALPPMKKRVAVAKDVLLQLEAGKLVAQSMSYGHIEGKGGSSPIPSGPLQDTLIQMSESGIVCAGCAKAAAMISRARLGNAVTVDGSFQSTEKYAHSVTDEIFGDKCAEVIEGVFEGWGYGSGISAESKAIREFTLGLRNESSHDRMVAIYKNIVKNRGRLVIGKYKY